MENKNRKFNLKFGYQDKENPDIFHREVVISKRPTAEDLMEILAFDGASSDIQINLSLIAKSISVFGTLGMPVSITVLLSLNEIDENKLNEEYLMFLLSTQPETEQKVLEDNRAQLAFGIERKGVKYHTVEFGNLLNGYDRIKLSEDSQNNTEYSALKIGREVVGLSTLDGEKSVSGELTLDEIKAMDVTDFMTLREAESQWLDSFRD